MSNHNRIDPQFALNIFYSDSPDDGATYLHASITNALDEMEGVYNSTIEGLEEEGIQVTTHIVNRDKRYAMIYTNNDSYVLITVNAIYC